MLSFYLIMFVVGFLMTGISVAYFQGRSKIEDYTLQWETIKREMRP